MLELKKKSIPFCEEGSWTSKDKGVPSRKRCFIPWNSVHHCHPQQILNPVQQRATCLPGWQDCSVPPGETGKDGKPVAKCQCLREAVWIWALMESLSGVLNFISYNCDFLLKLCIYFKLVCVCVFIAGSRVSQSDFELSADVAKDDLKLQIHLSLYFDARVTGVCHHTWFSAGVLASSLFEFHNST